jgi:hypothetical protein
MTEDTDLVGHRRRLLRVAASREIVLAADNLRECRRAGEQQAE